MFCFLWYFPPFVLLLLHLFLWQLYRLFVSFSSVLLRIKTPLRLRLRHLKKRSVAKQQRDRRAPTQMHMELQSLSMPPRFDAHPPLHNREAGDSFKQTRVLLKPPTPPTPPQGRPGLLKCNPRRDVASGHSESADDRVSLWPPCASET